MNRTILAIGMLLVVGSVGCSPAVSSPRTTLQSLRTAIAQNDYAGIYALLPERSRRAESFEQFRARMQSNNNELKSLGDMIASALGTTAPVVEIPVRNGGGVTVVESPNGWALNESGIGPITAVRWQDAAQALRNALIRQSLPALLAILSPRSRGAIIAEMNAVIDALSDPSGLETPVMSGANSRRVQLIDGRQLNFVLEGNNWRVENLE